MKWKTVAKGTLLKWNKVGEKVPHLPGFDDILIVLVSVVKPDGEKYVDMAVYDYSADEFIPWISYTMCAAIGGKRLTYSDIEAEVYAWTIMPTPFEEEESND